MKYLKKVILKNFQSHKNSTIEFDEGLNIIVGPSDSGKSAIIRGIKWALYNDPLGDYFIREGENEASVTLEFSNNVKVKRLRSKSKNAYILYTNDNEEITFEGFGNKVPKEIVDVLSIKKIPLDSNETNAINLGEQLEGAFLLSEKGSVRASAIGRLVGVNLIDDALKETIKDLRNISIDKKIKVENIDKIKYELKSYEYLKALNTKLLSLEELKFRLKDKTYIKDKLSKSLSQYNIINKEKTDLNEKLLKLLKIDIIDKNIYNLNIKIKQKNFYQNKNDILKRIKDIIVEDNISLNKLSGISSIEYNIDYIDIKKNKLNKLKKIRSNLSYINNEQEKFILISKRLENIDYIQESTNIVEYKINRINVLNSLKLKKNSINKSLETGNNYIEKLSNINKSNNLFDILNDLIKKRKDLINLSLKLDNLKTETEKQTTIYIDSENQINYNLNSYKELLSTTDKCPFCLSTISENEIIHIIEHYS